MKIGYWIELARLLRPENEGDPSNVAAMSSVVPQKIV
jgi:hypothetical protein